MKYEEIKKQAFETVNHIGNGDGTFTDPISGTVSQQIKVEETELDEALILEVKTFPETQFVFCMLKIGECHADHRCFDYRTSFTVITSKHFPDEGIVIFNTEHEGKRAFLLKEIQDIWIEV